MYVCIYIYICICIYIYIYIYIYVYKCPRRAPARGPGAPPWPRRGKLSLRTIDYIILYLYYLHIYYYYIIYIFYIIQQHIIHIFCPSLASPRQTFAENDRKYVNNMLLNNRKYVNNIIIKNM